MKRLKPKLRNYRRKLMEYGPAFNVERPLLVRVATSGSMLRHIWMGCATLAISAPKSSGLKIVLMFTKTLFINNFTGQKSV